MPSKLQTVAGCTPKSQSAQALAKMTRKWRLVGPDPLRFDCRCEYCNHFPAAYLHILLNTGLVVSEG